MLVAVTNLTDAPGKSPTQIDVYNRVLNPGDSLRLPADLIDKRLRAMEKKGDLAIGQVPSWYSSAKTRRGKALTAEEMAKRVSPPRPTAPAPAPLQPKKLELLDEATPTDEFSRNKNKRKGD